MVEMVTMVIDVIKTCDLLTMISVGKTQTVICATTLLVVQDPSWICFNRLAEVPFFWDYPEFWPPTIDHHRCFQRSTDVLIFFWGTSLLMMQHLAIHLTQFRPSTEPKSKGLAGGSCKPPYLIHHESRMGYIWSFIPVNTVKHPDLPLEQLGLSNCWDQNFTTR